MPWHYCVSEIGAAVRLAADRGYTQTRECESLAGIRRQGQVEAIALPVGGQTGTEETDESNESKTRVQTLQRWCLAR